MILEISFLKTFSRKKLFVFSRDILMMKKIQYKVTVFEENSNNNNTTSVLSTFSILVLFKQDLYWNQNAKIKNLPD